MPSGPNLAWPVQRPNLQLLLDRLAARLETPLALMSHDGGACRFEGEAFPPDVTRSPGLPEVATQADTVIDPGGPMGTRMTGFVIGHAQGREWVLVAPGKTDAWRHAVSVNSALEDARRGLRRMLGAPDEHTPDRLARKIYGFSRRLGRETDQPRVHQLILRTIATHVRARLGALAVPVNEGNVLAITATYGYPSVIVEHLRIASGEGILGRAYATGRAAIREVEGQRRLRYRTTSYLVVPLMGVSGPIGVITLADRTDGEPFDRDDLADARLLAAPASLALARKDVEEHLDEIRRVASIDLVTGLLNRRHFEMRLQVEVQRARRLHQELALLMVDIDDFKRINDTFGHLEGDRALREVSDLLRGGVRIFDVCARYGGEEFAILMPGASRTIAVQVAERIRRGIHERSRLDPMPITVSVGVACLQADNTADDLVEAADLALMVAKRAGKNVVKTAPAGPHSAT
jgi:diguanylate cyclase (GGDEF)-like protein